MKKKKHILLLAIVLLLVASACNKSQDNVVPANDQKVLGMVLQAVTPNNSTNLILLKDGRTINPISGFNPASVKPGYKFILSFEPVSSSENKILNVHVTTFSIASDSTFVPPGSGGTDSATVKSILQGTHSCLFTYSQVNQSNPGDTSKLYDQSVSMNFDGNTFSSLNAPALPYFIPGGEGIFFFTSTNKNVINFVNTREFPSEAPPGFILNNMWNLAVFESYVLIWRNGSFTLPDNTVINEFSSFKINR